ncbi:MAG: hypothetical protein QMB71_00435 [Tolumonas sp.]
MQPKTMRHDMACATKNDQLVIKHDTLCKKIDDFGCHIVELYATLKAFPLVTGTGWRISHPQAATKPRTMRIHSPVTGTLPVISKYLGAWVGSQRKRPRCAFLGLALTCGYPIRLGLSKTRILIMVYTFLIAATRGRIADVQRIRTISAVANTETEARARLTGLPLIFMSRTPAQGGAV